MFESARIKLTAWYVLIIMFISVAFSTFIYFGATREFDRILRVQRSRINHPQAELRIFPNGTISALRIPDEGPDEDVIYDAKLRVLYSLLGVNSVILLLSTTLGYFLAGRTLRPIQKMVDEQHRFITDASHELHTPLTSLRTTLEVNLRDKSLTLLKAKDVLVSNLEDVVALQGLSQDLLSLSKYQSAPVAFEKIKIAEVIQEAKENIAALAKKKNIQFALPRTSLTVRGDKKLLKELFVILFDNAIKYSPAKTKVTVSVKPVDKKVLITVADEGYGIAEKDMPHIFDRFYRVDSSRTKQKVSGYGLGLSIAKEIVEKHSGSMTVASIVGKGSEFSIFLTQRE